MHIPRESQPTEVDLLVIGGGINGVGIARDAAGRGMKVVLVERGDLAGATSSSSSKLIHGGLRYLEQFEFKLVGEALAERKTLLRCAPHLVWPARFIMPHVPELRPRWMIRTGLFLYDHLDGHWRNDRQLPNSRAVRLDQGAYSSGLNGRCKHGFIYSDCRTDDARLVIANARDAVAHHAMVFPHTELVSAHRHAAHWDVMLSGGRALRCRMIANVTGPWVKEVLNHRLGVPSADSVRLVRGSHVVFPRLYGGDHAFILQNDDRRIVFMIPYQRDFTLVGTTDIVESGDPGTVKASDEEVEYLCRAVGRYLQARPSPTDVVWKYAGVRPLYDDGSGDPSAVTRDYTLRVDAQGAPVLSVFGGKLTTYRYLSEQAVNSIAHTLGLPGKAWTANGVLPGGDFGGLDFSAFREKEVASRYPWLPLLLQDDLARRHGSDVFRILGHARALQDLGRHFGGGLTEAEVEWMRKEEWAIGVDDLIWRRSKCGLRMSAQERMELQAYLSQ